uniref:Uncharacterized protein n=1 Tax=viral metagenome TaxID=1070528 RepID=A0A6C0HWV6_9ZZZZ
MTTTDSKSNIFQEVLTDVGGVEERLLGPSYPYWKNIKTPSQIGMSDEGSLNALGKDINGLIQYVEVLVTGASDATGGKVLGNKFFLQTGGKCKDVATSKDVDRYIYINNVPQGNIPFISSGLGTNFTEFKGLIPGTMSNLNVLNPFTIMQAFMSGATPDCREISLEVVDNNSVSSSETHFVSVVDLQNMDACSFPNKINPISGKVCSESFTTMDSEVGYDSDSKVYLPSDPIVQIFFASIGLLGIYILFCLIEKNRGFSGKKR